MSTTRVTVASSRGQYRGLKASLGYEQRAKSIDSLNITIVLAHIFVLVIAFAVLCGTVGSFVWTNDNLSPTDIPYYNTGMHALNGERWNFAHVLLVLQIPMFLLATMSTALVLAKPFHGWPYQLHYFFCTLCMIFNLLMVGYLIYTVVAGCTKSVLCASETGSAVSGYWIFLIIGNILMLVPLGTSIWRMKTAKDQMTMGLYVSSSAEVPAKLIEGAAESLVDVARLDAVFLMVAFVALCGTVGSFAWTNANLSASDIPYYDAAMEDLHGERWNFAHLLLVLQIPMFILPILGSLFVIAEPYRRAMYVVHYVLCALCDDIFFFFLPIPGYLGEGAAILSSGTPMPRRPATAMIALPSGFMCTPSPVSQLPSWSAGFLASASRNIWWRSTKPHFFWAASSFIALT